MSELAERRLVAEAGSHPESSVGPFIQVPDRRSEARCTRKTPRSKGNYCRVDAVVGMALLWKKNQKRH